MLQKHDQSIGILMICWCSILEVGAFSDNLVGMRERKALAIAI